jgi:hypothetical protein
VGAALPPPISSLMIHRAGKNFSFGKNLRFNLKALVKDKVKKASYAKKK